MTPRRKILLVDDSPSVLKVLRFLMQKEGYEVIEAHNGVAGLEAARREGPDVVFLDVMMPGMDGFSVLREIRADPALRGIFVIVLSAKGQDQDREKALALRADEFWMKPFSPSAVQQRLRDLFSGREAAVRAGTEGREPAAAGFPGEQERQ